MMAGSFSVGVFFLIEMEADGERELVELGVAVEARIAGAGKSAYEAYLTLFFMLKNIAGAAEERDRVFGESFDKDFHMGMTDN